jgi:AhpC/TSA family
MARAQVLEDDDQLSYRVDQVGNSGIQGEEAMQTHWMKRIGSAAALLSMALWMMPMLARAVEVGDKAPDFFMHSTVGETVRLADYQGKKTVLLFFFLAAFTGV